MIKTKLIFLGCGSSIGVPRIDGYWGNCKKVKKNFRTRSSIIIQKGKNNILIDTSPDLRTQFLKNKIKNVSFVLYTHEHADQTHGINDLRAFYWKNKKKIEVFGNSRTINILKKQFNFCFKSRNGYPSFLNSNIIKKEVLLGEKKEKVLFKAIEVNHGTIKSLAYLFEKTAYISDCNGISNSAIESLKNLKYLIIDCLKIKKHPSHFNLAEAIKISKLLMPKKTILTNLHHDLDYNILLNRLPKNITPAYDGLKLYL